MHPFNVVIFGEAGVGKSSVVNLIAGQKVAETSADSRGRTLESKQYTFQVARKTYNVWTTTGLGEPVFSVKGYLGAIEKAYLVIQQITAEGGLDLLLFCMPGSGSQISQTMLCNYRLFFEVLCEKRIPIALVVTHLEGETRMDDWWIRNMHYLNHCGLKFTGHACVTGLPGHEKEKEGRGALEHLLLGYDHEGRYTMPTVSEWNLGFLTRLAASLIPRQKGVKDKRKQLERILRDRCMMHAAVARRLAESLTRPAPVHAE